MNKVCNICRRDFSTGYNLKRHKIKQHHIDNEQSQKGYGNISSDAKPNSIRTTILVPHELMGKKENITRYLTNLDREMLTILKDDSLPIDVKHLKYNQILKKFQTAKHESEKPIKIEIHKMSTDSKEFDEEPAQYDSLQDEITDTVPHRFQKQANLLLKYARKSPHIKWSDKGEMIVDGNKIVGSNIVDIINDLSRDRKTQPALGSDVFLKKLVDENVPTEIIVNKKRLSLLDRDVYASSEAKLHTEDRPSPKRTRGSSLLHNWTGLNL